MDEAGGEAPPPVGDHPGPRRCCCDVLSLQAPRKNMAIRFAEDPLYVRVCKLEQRVAELETALMQSQSQSHAVSVSQSQKNKPASTHITAKPKAEPWKDVGVSKATYYRRLKAAD